MRLTFLGAARMVTGSSYLIEAGNSKVLIDCGMFQGSRAITDLNRRDFLYNPLSIDCVLLTHAHIDHSGLIPKLCKSGFKGPIYTTKATTELCSIMLPDSGHIQEFDAEIQNRKRLRTGRELIQPIYTVDEAYIALKQFSPVAYSTETQVTPEVKVRFVDAGHILGSSILEVWVTEHSKTTKLVFSGDLGQPDQPIIKDPTYIEAADYIITESTYGNRSHEEYDKEDRLAQIITDTVQRGGNVIIPSFAVGRTQTLLYYLHKLYKSAKIPDIPVFIDSPLAISATDIFMHNTQEYDAETYNLLVNTKENPLMMPHLNFTKTAEESKRLNTIDSPAIIISASGMADAGRILYHLKHNLWRPESSVLFVGYQAQGSMGRRLLEGVKRVKIMGEDIHVKAEIYNLEGFSAHADQEDLLKWLSKFTSKPANIFLVHGEDDMTEPFAALIRERLDLNSYIPHYGDSVVINQREWKIEESNITIIDPAVRRMYDSMVQFEAEYRAQRKRLERFVQDNPGRVPDVMQRMTKVGNYFKKLFDDLR